MATELKVTAQDFMSERRDFFNLSIIESRPGSFDIVLRVDGSYSNRQMAQEALEGMRWYMKRIDDLPKDGWEWWHRDIKNPFPGEG